MNTSVTNRQIFFILLLIISSFRTIDIPQLAAKTAGRSGWIPILPYAVLFAAVAICITKLNTMYPGKTLVEYGREILGKVLANIICIYFVFYFFFVGIYLSNNLASFITSNFLPKTPQYFTLAVGTVLFGWIVHKGIVSIGRLFEILGTLYLITTLTLCFLMLTQGIHENILPLYSSKEGGQLFSKAIAYGSIFGGLEHLFLIPFAKDNQKAPQAAFFSVLAIGILFVLIAEGSINMLGVNNAITYSDAFIEAIKLAEAPVIERTDIFYLTFGLASLFAGLIILYYSIVELISRMLPKASRPLITAIIGALSYAASLVALKIPPFPDMAKKLLPIIVLLSAAVFPVILFIVAKIRKRASA